MTATKQIKLLNKLAKNLETAMNEIEKKLEKWITENQPTANICTRDEAKYGCQMCQEFWQLIDEIKKEVAEAQREVIAQETDESRKFLIGSDIRKIPLVTETNTEK